jgi:hypothetical protein
MQLDLADACAKIPVDTKSEMESRRKSFFIVSVLFSFLKVV